MNTVPGSYAARFINGNGDFFFTWPSDLFTTPGADLAYRKGHDPKISPQAYKYITRTNEMQMVLLAPGNKLPFIQLTRGEYIDLAEKAVIKDGGSSSEKYKATIAQLRTMYKGALDKPAMLRNMQPTLNSFYSAEGVFSSESSQRDPSYPIYKIKEEVMLKGRTDQPNWIAVWFPFQSEEDGTKEYEMYRAMTENVNYDYIYNYFFEPEKVKGMAYKPNNEAAYQARLAGYRNMYTTGPKVKVSAAKKAPNVLIDDDFADVSDKLMPPGWFKRSDGKPSGVTTLKSKPGKWLKLGTTNAVFPQDFATPLPANFLLEFDLATDPDFSGYTGGGIRVRFSTSALAPNGDLQLAPDKQDVELEIIAGNDYNLKAASNYRGTFKGEIHGGKSPNVENYKEGIYFGTTLTEFTDKKTSVHIGVRMKNGECLLLVNGKPFSTSGDAKLGYGKPCILCGVPAATRFKSIGFKNITNTDGDVGVYISNVKLVKE